MTSGTKKEFLQKYMLDSYSRAIPTKVAGKVASLDAVDTRRPKQQAEPKDEDDGDVYELAQQPADDYDLPHRKPSPKPRSSKQSSPQKHLSPSSPQKEGDKGPLNPGASPDTASEIQTPKRRPCKKVVEIDYEIASEIRPYRPKDSSAGKSSPAQTQSDSKVSINHENRNVPSSASSQSPRSFAHSQDSKGISAKPSSPQSQQPDFVYSMSQAGAPSAGPEGHYEEPWDLKARRLKQEQETKGKKLAKRSALNKEMPVYEEAWDSPSQQRKLEERLSYARSLSTTSDSDVFHDAVDSMPDQKTETPSGPNVQADVKADGNLKPLPQNTYEDAWDLKNSILEQKIREMQLQASATYEEPWDRSKQQQQLQAKFNAQTSEPGSLNKQGKSVRQRSSSDAYDAAWEGNDPNSKSFVNRGKYHSVDESKIKGRGHGCNIGQRIDPMIPLANQNWYHGNISRDDAEKMLCVCKEGSYIVRISSDRKSYSLSIKSLKQNIHVQIEQRTSEDGTVRYILGKNSKEFCSIPEMIDYYTHHRVPLKGAEHITLLHPVDCKWS